MELLGTQFIGSSTSAIGKHIFQARDPKTNSPLPGEFHEAVEGEVHQAATHAEAAFKVYSRLPAEQRASFLEAIAEEILALDHSLIIRAESETSLPFARLQGERGRTVNQLKLFAQVIREGSWVDARIDTALPAREPLPRPDIRQMLKPLGPVAIFGASNFPLAFSVAGGDTASALASGCTVVVKGHPAHPGTSELTARAILSAAEKTGMPDGVFSLLQGQTHEVGSWLVKHPLIKAVGFTGSFKGGKALYDTANRREIPIPVFAEMGSTNPVFVLPGALASQGETIAQGLAASITLGVGQFCTNPGLTFIPEVSGAVEFQRELARCINEITAGNMLTETIKETYNSQTKELAEDPAVEALASGFQGEGQLSVQARIFKVKYPDFKSRPEWGHEIFGPSSILVDIPSKEELLQAASSMEGHLTATVYGTDEDFDQYRELFQILERKVGRVVVNGFPTGVEVCHAMVHGGPYPATTAPQTTSVGTNAIKRFVRPVCFQNYPPQRLPEALMDSNPLEIFRLINGNWTREAVIDHQEAASKQ